MKNALALVVAISVAFLGGVGCSTSPKTTEEKANLDDEAQVALVDGTHYGTEKPPQLAMVEWFRKQGLETDFLPDVPR